ncbi:MAG: endolytic transglycosylase MltG [Bacteroidaceae bacterium]|nr:endolytic transglycosylase MltG [Bacteroidaceae bacterium]
MNTRRKYILWTTGGLAALVLVCASVLWKGINGSPFDINETAYVYVRPGDSAETVREQCCALGGSSTRLYWRLANWLRPYQVHTGRYAIEPGTSFLRAYLALQRGHQTPVRLTIPSVRTMNRLVGFLSHQLMLDSAETARQLGDSAVAAAYGYSTATLPALFIPNTYEVYWDTSLATFLQRMQRENARFWEQEGRHAAAEALGMSHEEVITLASIVDEETANNGEKPRVAGLYLNRLQKGIPLQADPTVKFATGDPTLRRIRSEHLRIESPYNTYLHKGLPPGPIRIPSVAGIDAVLHLEHHNYLYMCAKEDFSGTHNFAATFAEHQQNARRYQRALNARGIR